MEYIPLGVVGRPFGIRGELRIKPFNPDTTWFLNARGLWLENEKGEPDYFEIERTRRHKDSFLVTLSGVDDRDAADALRGRLAVAPEDALEPLSEDEYYWHQLIGLSVEDEAGKRIGEVVNIMKTGPASVEDNDLLVVLGEEGEILVPMASAVIGKIDLASGRIVVLRESL